MDYLVECQKKIQELKLNTFSITKKGIRFNNIEFRGELEVAAKKFYEYLLNKERGMNGMS